MDLSKIDTKALRAELSRRTERERAKQEEAFRHAYPCPECGADPVELNTEMVEEFRFAPRDDEGRPMLYAPYGMGTTKGARYEMTLTCTNGHVTTTDRVKWFENPVAGPPLLR